MKRVRIFGTDSITSGGGATNAAEIYDPVANTWTSVAGGMIEARTSHTATLLQDRRVLLAGGQGASGTVSLTAEIFDSATQTFALAGILSSARTAHGAARLSDGRVLIAGGSNGTNPLLTSDIYDPTVGSISAGPNLSTPRQGLSATALLDGRVLVAGGNNGSADLASGEICDAGAGAFSAVASTLATARRDHQAFLLPNNNNVLIVGGTSSGAPLASAEMFVPWGGASQTGAFKSTGAMAALRSSAAGSPLSLDGLLLVAGGKDASGATLSSAELYGFATVKTDKSDYAPGETVTITGKGWQPGETVTLTFVESPLIDTHGPFTAVADASGNIFNNQFVADQHDISILFYLTATGSVSQAQTTFTDGSVTAAPVATEQSNCSTPSSAFTYGDTVCAKVGAVTVTGTGNGNLHVQWIDPTATVVRDTTFNVANNATVTDSFAPTSTGTWKVQTCKGGAAPGPPFTACAGNSLLASATFTVARKALTVTGITVNPKTYDGTTTATLNTASAVLVGVVSGDTVSLDSSSYTANFSTANAGTGLAVTVSGLGLSGASAAKYTLTQPTGLTGTINPKTLTVTGLAASNKVYDATTAATLTGTAALQTAEAGGTGTTSDGKPYTGDTVSVTGTPSGTFASANVGNGISVSVSGLSLSGAQAGNYTLTSPTLSANITPKALTYSGVSVPGSKTYDGTTAATVSGTPALQAAEAGGSGTTSDGKPYTGDTVSLSGTATGTYNSKDVASATTVTFAGVSLTGAQAGNYTLTALTQAATITAKALTYSGVSVPGSKTYDGTTAATVSGTPALQAAETGGSGTTSDGKPYTGDTVSLSGTATGTYNSKDVASATTVTFAGVSLTGTDSGNYTLTALTQAATITPATLTYVADAKSRVYGAPNPPFTGKVTGFVNGEMQASATTGTLTFSSPATATSNVGSYAINGSGLTANNGNYTFVQAAGNATALTITPANTTTGVSNASATFGDANVTLTASVTANSPSTAMVNEGTVTFTVMQGITLIGSPVSSGTVSGGTATASFPLSSPTVVYAGSYSIQATYNPATNFNGSSAATAGTLTVKPAPTVSTVTVTPSSQQYSNLVSFTATLSPASINGKTPATGVTFYVGTQALAGAQSMGSCTLAVMGSVLTCQVMNVPLLEPAFPPPAPGNMAPGSHTVYAIFGGVDSNNFIVANPTATLTIKTEDAAATYTRALFASTANSTSVNATVTLSATIQDATAILPTSDPRYDPNPGDIRNATVTFVNRDAGNAPLNTTPLPVGLVNLSDTKTGTVTYNWNVAIPSCSSPPCFQTYTIGIIVNNYYTHDSSADNTVVNVAQPGNNFITGGGYLVMTSSAGQAAGAAGTKNNFGFNVKYNKQGTNLQGNINTIVRSTTWSGVCPVQSGGVYVYQVKGNSMTSLSVDTTITASHPYPTATFNGKASIQDITNPLSTCSVDGNATLQVTMTDKGEPGSSDTIAITVWNKSGGLWFSSYWNGTNTVEHVLGGGNLMVH